MRTEVIRADSIDAAVERILNQLKEDTGTRGSGTGENVIYFDGWDGLCASAVLRTVAAEALATLQFDQVVHVDCSNWVNRRALQRSMAEHLQLPPLVMDMFNIQDVEDDFNGVPQETRDALLPVREAMLSQWEQMLNRKFLVIFINGSDEEIDLASFCGLPLYGYSRNRVLWTFQGRFRLKPKAKVDRSIKRTDVVMSATHHEMDPQELWSYLVLQEAVDLRIAAHNSSALHDDPSCIIDDQPAQTAECFLYMWKLCGMVHNLRTDYDLATHCCNYWICDAVIQPQQGQDGTNNNEDGGPWRSAHALQHEMRLDVDYYHNHNLYEPLSSHLGRCAESMARLPHWTSLTLLCSYTGTVQFFPTEDMFQRFSKVCVLKLSHCTFTFSSAPFLRCHNLRFLWLDHCHDQESRGTDSEGTEKDIPQFFQKLWVLDVRYTSCHWILSTQMLELMTHLQELIVIGVQDWDMSQLQGLLPNIRKIRIKNSTIKCGGSSSENGSLFSGMMKKIELLDFSGNKIISGGVRSLIMTANNSRLLETVIIDEGCIGLEQISFSGGANLKNVLLRGLFEGLQSIDISGTSVKTLDLSAVEAKELDELVALGCGKLCAILWPPEKNRKRYLRKIRIGTTMEDGTNATSSSSLTVKYGAREPMEYFWYVSVKDARLLRSLVPFEEYFDNLYDNLYVQMEISSASLAERGGSQEENRIIETSVSGGQLVPVNQEKRQQLVPVYADVTITFTDHVPQANDDGDDALTSSTQTWPCPRAPLLDNDDCYVHIQDQPVTRTRLPPRASRDITVPDMMCWRACILHVHDSKSIPNVPGPLEGSTWRWLKWCRVERCPGLDCVFVCPQAASDKALFYYLETLWCSQLPRVRCIWNFSGSSLTQRFHSRSFKELKLVHVDLCPRLTHVVPLWAGKLIDCMFRYRLETIEIVWCGDIRAAFPFDNTEADQSREEDEQQETTTPVEFPSLKHIHLHELPKLLGMCGRRRIYAPNLESIKVRGCWSLTRLPAVGNGDYNNKVNCDCEKEWWNNLKWDGKNHRSLYKPMHPRHNKKTLLRSSVLR